MKILTVIRTSSKFIKAMIRTNNNPTISIEIWGSDKPMREFLYSWYGRCLCVFDGKDWF